MPRRWGDAAAIANVRHALDASGHQTEVVRLNSPDDAVQLRRDGLFVFPNGRYFAGEANEFLSDLLDEWRVPYVGSGATGLNAESKSYMKSVLVAARIPTPSHRVIDSLPGSSERIGLRFPVVIKPDRGTESIGVTRVDDCGDLASAMERLAATYGFPLVVEEWCRSREFTAAVIGNGTDRQAFPVEVVVDDVYFTEAAKLETRETCKRINDPVKVRLLSRLATASCEALKIRDWARVDMLEDASDDLYVIDVNTLPGLRRGPHKASHLPICLAINCGLDYDESILAVVGTAFCRYGFEPSVETQRALSILQAPKLRR
jgi:D-alanine-D-alanine ligase